MSISLPRLVVLGAGGPAPRIAETPPNQQLSREEVELLMRQVTGERVADHCEPLERHRWAVGRQMTPPGASGVYVWRVVSEEARLAIGGHPAWLWNEDDWFDPGTSSAVDVGLPTALPLRQLLLHAGSALGRGSQPATVAAVVEAARTSDRPIALKVSEAALSGHDHRGRWAALAVMAVLPTAVGNALRMRVGQPPGPDSVDLAVVIHEPKGFNTIDISRPPRRVHDVAAYFVHERLTDDDPEAVEAAGALYGQGDEDWVGSITGLIREGVLGSRDALDSLGGATAQSKSAPPAADQSDDELSAAAIEELVQQARKTGDPGPWRALRRRPAVQRSTAVRALAAAAETLEPTAELVTELAVVYPRGATLDEWLPALLGWLERDIATEAVVKAIQTVLLEWPKPVTNRLRLAVWPALVAELVKLGKGREAVQALLRSPMAEALAKDGHGQALIDGWRELPRSERGTPQQKALAALLRSAPNGAELFAALKKGGTGAPAPSRERATSRAPTRATPKPASAAPSPRETPATASGRAPAPAAPRAPVRQPRRKEAPEADARAELLALARRAVVNGDVEAHMLTTAAKAVAQSRFPDADIAGVAEELAGQAETNRVWGWVALTAAPPGTWSDEIIDATLYAFCADPPTDRPGRLLAVATARALGQARKWDPIGHARWIVQLSIAPESPMNKPLVKALLEGIGARTDGTPFLADLMQAVLQLPPDHEAVRWLLDALVPSGWRGDRLARVLRSIPSDRVSPQLASRWNALLQEARA